MCWEFSDMLSWPTLLSPKWFFSISLRRVFKDFISYLRCDASFPSKTIMLTKLLCNLLFDREDWFFENDLTRKFVLSIVSEILLIFFPKSLFFFIKPKIWLFGEWDETIGLDWYPSVTLDYFNTFFSSSRIFTFDSN